MKKKLKKEDSAEKGWLDRAFTKAEREWLLMPFWMKIQQHMEKGSNYLRCKLGGEKKVWHRRETNVIVTDHTGKELSGFVPNNSLDRLANLLEVEVLSLRRSCALVRIPGETFTTKKVWVKVEDLWGAR